MATKKFIELQDFTVEQLNSELDQTVKQYQKLEFDPVLDILLKWATKFEPTSVI